MLKKVLTKRLAVLLSLLFLMLQFNFIVSVPKAVALSNYVWNSNIPVKYPSAINNNGKLVLFDNSHGETAGQADWVLDGGFSDFADDLVAHGYTVREYRGVDKNGDGIIRYYDDRQSANVSLNEAVITYDAIKNADVFVIAEANRPLTISERDALKQFVDSGKGIYFVADHYNSDRNMNTWDSTEVYNGYNRSTATTYNMGGIYGDLRNPQDGTKGWLAETFGLRFRFNAINLISGFTGIRSTADSEGVTRGVLPVLMAAGATLSIVDGNKAKGVVYLGANDSPTKWGSAADSGIYFGGEAEGAYVAISKPSLGKAAFIGDSSPIEDDTCKYKNEGSGSTKSTHPGYKSAGNAAILSVNIVNWLSTPESYIGFDGINHTKGINTPTPMATAEKTQTQAEPWSTPSYDPWNTDTYAYGSYNAPQGPSSTTTVGVTGVTVSPTSATMNVGNTLSLTANISPTNATDKTVTWSSSNTAVASVSNGIVTANGTGSAVITVKTNDGAKTAACNITVAGSTVSVTGVTLNRASMTLGVGSTQTLTATITPTNATNQNVTWSSSNTTIATVSGGVVTAKAEGSAVITVTTADGGKTAACTVTVAKALPASISEGFNSVIGTSTGITSGIPAGWTFSSGMAIYNTSGNYGLSAPAVKLQATGNQITTPSFALTAQTTLSFWIKGNGTDTISHLLVQKYDGTSWTTIADISSLPIVGTTKTYIIAQNISQIRFTYTKNVGNLSFDDVKIGQ